MHYKHYKNSYFLMLLNRTKRWDTPADGPAGTTSISEDRKRVDGAAIVERTDFAQNQRVSCDNLGTVVDVCPTEREVEVVRRGTDETAIQRYRAAVGDWQSVSITDIHITDPRCHMHHHHQQQQRQRGIACSVLMPATDVCPVVSISILCSDSAINTRQGVETQSKVILDLNPNYWINPDSDPDVCRIAPKCCGFIILLFRRVS